MTLQTLITIILISFAIIFCIAVLILTFFYGRSTIKDNPNEALIFVKTGKHISKPMKGKQTDKPTQRGNRFNYGKDKILFVPNTYADIYFNNKRMLFISNIGQLIATPFDTDIALSPDERDELIYEMCSSHIGADSMKALKGKGITSIIIVAVIAFIIGIIVVFGYNYIQTAMTQPIEQPAISDNLTQPITIKPAK